MIVILVAAFVIFKTSFLFLSVCFPLPYIYIILLYLYLFNSLFTQILFNFIVYFSIKQIKRKGWLFAFPAFKVFLLNYNSSFATSFTYSVIIQNIFFLCDCVFFLTGFTIYIYDTTIPSFSYLFNTQSIQYYRSFYVCFLYTMLRLLFVFFYRVKR